MTTKMDFTPTKREITSTPFIPSSDSGYFGSCAESRYKNAFYSLSPLKESPCKNVHSSPFVSPINIVSPIFKSWRNIEHQQNYTGVVKQLNFNDSGWGNDPASLKECNPVTKFPLFLWDFPDRKPAISSSKNLPDQSRIKAKVDFLEKLKTRNMEHVISNILSYLVPEDLIRVKGVNKTWKEVVLKDVKANRRRKDYIKKRKSQIENRRAPEIPPEEQRYKPRLIFDDITNNDFKPPLPKCTYNTRFESFLREGKNIQNGILVKCPRCSYAAKSQNEDIYKCSECHYIFCKKSLCPVINVHSSPVLPLPNLIVGSKRCKKNLRRL